MTAEERYAHLKALANSVPQFGSRVSGRVTDPVALNWLGRLAAFLKDYDTTDWITLKVASDSLGTALHEQSLAQIINALHRALASCELEVAPATRGAFIAVGSAFDAITVVKDIFSSITSTILIVDTYMDGRVLQDFAPLAPEGTAIALLTDESGIRPNFEPMCRAWTAQWGAKRPLQLRVTSPRTLHDRLILGDQGDAWILTQSLKDFAVRSPATVQKVDRELAEAKFAAYSGIWTAARDPLT